MRKTVFSILVCFLLTALNCQSKALQRNVAERIDWPTFMQRQDPKWEVLPEYWYESAFMGNGMMGLMVYKEPDSNYIRLETGHCAVHDHRPGSGLFENPRLLTGHFALHPQGEITGGTMRVDLWNAETHAEIITTRGTIRMDMLVHSDDMAIRIHTTATDGEKDFSMEWIPADAQSPRYLYSQTKEGSWVKPPSRYEPNPTAEVTPGLSVQRLLHGGVTATAWSEKRKGKNERTYLASIAHSYPDDGAIEEVRSMLRRVGKKNPEKWLKTHRDWWHSYYPKSFVTLDDPVKENFYWMQMYKLACATRSDRALIDNTGPWLTVTPWPNAWWNLNVQLTYWPLNASNHLELAESLENAIYANTDNLRANVPEGYSEDALAINRSSDLNCVSGAVGIPGETANAEVGLLTWTCHNLWLIYRHKMDDKVLRDKLYPVLRQSINYYLKFLIKDEEGYWHLPATYSPEYGSAEDCNFDLALLKWGCLTLLDITGRLGIDDPLIARWQNVARNLTPFPEDETEGLLIGRDTPYAFSHRHYSHMLAAYPLYLLNPEIPANRALIERSMKHWLSKPEGLRGYSSTGASSISAMLGKGDDALFYLDQLVNDFLSVNTMYVEAGPVIETPLSGVQSMFDMLLQSWGDRIRIFPAVPSAWQNVAFSDLRTEGAFLVTAERRDGQTHFVSVRSLAGEPCIIVTDINNPVFTGKRQFKTERLSHDTYRIDLQAGEEVLIREDGDNGECVITPLPSTRSNLFGKKSS